MSGGQTDIPVANAMLNYIVHPKMKEVFIA